MGKEKKEVILETKHGRFRMEQYSGPLPTRHGCMQLVYKDKKKSLL